jgi:hypothetical protein
LLGSKQMEGGQIPWIYETTICKQSDEIISIAHDDDEVELQSVNVSNNKFCFIFKWSQPTDNERYNNKVSSLHEYGTLIVGIEEKYSCDSICDSVNEEKNIWSSI